MVPQSKVALAVNAVSATQTATITSTPIDRIGYRFATIDLWGTTQGLSTQAGSPTVLKLQEADDTSATSFVDVVGFRGGSATATNVDFVVGIGATAGTNGYKFNVDLRARKRYLSLVATLGNLNSTNNSQTFYSVANLFRAEQSPSTAAKANVLSLIEG